MTKNDGKQINGCTKDSANIANISIFDEKQDHGLERAAELVCMENSLSKDDVSLRNVFI